MDEKSFQSNGDQVENQPLLDPMSYLFKEYSGWQAKFNEQPVLTQHFFEMQAQILAEALIQRSSQVHFSFPDFVITERTHRGKEELKATVPSTQREQLVGGVMDRLTRTKVNEELRQRLDELEASPIEGISISAGLIRYVTVIHLVHHMLPSGRSVHYVAAEGEEIPINPTHDEQDVASAIMAHTDAVAEGVVEPPDRERGELQVPYAPEARRFYLPQWVAFGDEDRLLVKSLAEAESYLASMQRFIKVLHAAVALAPYIVVDEQYQQKRYGMLGQLINQGRSLARYETCEIITTIKKRSAANDLNRGLSISLPFFDDQILKMKSLDFTIIPAGRIMFIPGFVVLASRKEQAKVSQDTRLSRSTRKHLLHELQMLEVAFDQPNE